ncbi:MAG TPA: M23 family metallopeptidase [Propionibacteriaceae bacterium]|nr:M23 family metallopeptidase [Propionibacteriaceae bacterium]
MRRPPPPLPPRPRVGHLLVLLGLALAVCLLPAAAWAEGAAFTVRPLDTPITAGFDGAPAPWLPGHRGVDFAALPGTPVRAPADGVVSFTGVVVDRPVLTLRHSAIGGREALSSFEPLVAAVGAGQWVRAGQLVGWAGDGGHCGGRCVHWGVRVGDGYVDPLALLAASVRLLPLDARPVPLPVVWPAPPAPPAPMRGGPVAGRAPLPADVLLRAVLSVV